jgi:hypothetical protein
MHRAPASATGGICRETNLDVPGRRVGPGVLARLLADDVAVDGSTAPDPDPDPDPDPEPGPDPAPKPDRPPSPPSDESPGSPGAPCLLDADCGSDTFCELRICVAGCPDAALCDADEVCDPHGRCVATEGEVPEDQHAGAPVLTDRFTVLAFGETQARTILRNAGTRTLTYRLAAENAAVTLDTASATLAPGEEVELIADVDLAAPAPADRVLPVQIITSGGAVLWALTLDTWLAAGNFRGAVSFDIDGLSLGSSASPSTSSFATTARSSVATTTRRASCGRNRWR